MAKQGMIDDLQMPESRRQILLALKEQSSLTADDLAAQLDISAVAVRRHLDNLKHSGLIEYEEVRQGMGRPSYVYSLTGKTDQIFPRNYEELAQDVLDTIRDLYGEDAVDAIFDKRFEKIKEIYQKEIDGQTLQERIEQLVALRQKDGYMARWQKNEDGTFIMTERNCPIQSIAAECCEACAQDLQLFVELLDANVKREDHLVQGDDACSYQIAPREIVLY
ncbi:MAG: metalloregulator ArsR/SmtB family transcription factor [Chloroflexota bacterium]